MKRTYSIKNIVTVSNLILMLLFLVINLFYSNHSYKKVLLEEFLQKQLQTNTYVKETLEQSVKEIEMLAASTANNSTIANSINNYSSKNTTEENSVFSKNINHNLSVVAFSKSEIVSVNIVLENFTFYTTLVNSVYSYDRYFPDIYIEKIRSTSSCWLPTRVNDLCMATFDKYILSYTQKLYSNKYNGKVLGHLVINIKEEFLYQQIRRAINSGISTILMVDQDGNILSSNDRNVLGKSIAQTDYADLPINTNSLSENIMDNKQIISSEKTGNGWLVICITDSDKVLYPIHRTNRNTLIFGILIIVLMGTANSLITRFISRPIIELADTVSKYNSEADLLKRLPEQNRIFEISVFTRKFNMMTNQISDLIARLYSHEQKLREDELRILQSQINPHFIYNTLETINWMALEKGQDDLSHIVIMLGNFLRLSLNKGKWTYRVQDELNHLNSYMEIQRVRSKDGIVFNSQIDESCLNFNMIKLLIQPIVENSIIHGFNKRGGNGVIDLIVRKEEQGIIFIIRDNGCGMPPESVRNILDNNCEIGHGIKNVNNRIRLCYGDNYGITIHSVEGEGTEVIIRISQDIPKQHNS